MHRENQVCLISSSNLETLWGPGPSWDLTTWSAMPEHPLLTFFNRSIYKPSLVSRYEMQRTRKSKVTVKKSEAKECLKIHVWKIPVCLTNPSQFCWSSNQCQTKASRFSRSALMFTLSMDLDMTSKAKSSHDIIHLSLWLPCQKNWESVLDPA